MEVCVPLEAMERSVILSSRYECLVVRREGEERGEDGDIL